MRVKCPHLGCRICGCLLPGRVFDRLPTLKMVTPTIREERMEVAEQGDNRAHVCYGSPGNKIDVFLALTSQDGEAGPGCERKSAFLK